jgi:hypothetical protein
MRMRMCGSKLTEFGLESELIVEISAVHLCSFIRTSHV